MSKNALKPMAIVANVKVATINVCHSETSQSKVEGYGTTAKKIRVQSSIELCRHKYPSTL
jgi:hypothetical protein